MNFYENVCKAFVEADIEFIIIGGFAVNFWGYNRSTGDLDFFVNPSRENLSKLYGSLDSLGFLIDSDAKKAIQSGELVQFSDAHQTVEILFRINIDKTFQEIYKSAQISNFGNVEVPFIDFDDLIMEKLKSKRPKDLNDVHELKKIRGIG